MKTIYTILLVFSMNLVFCQTDLLQNLKTVETTLSTVKPLNTLTLNPVQVNSIDIYTYDNYIPIKTGTVIQNVNGSLDIYKLNSYNVPVKTYQVNRNLNNNLDIYKLNQYNIPVKINTVNLNNTTPIFKL